MKFGVFLPGADPGVAWRAERARRWDALRAWFAPEVVAGAPDTPEAQPKIAALVETGAIKGVVQEVFDLEQGAKAMELVERGRVRGKVVLRV